FTSGGKKIMADDPLDRMGQAIAAGPLAVLRLRAEVLLERIDDEQHPDVSVEEREELARIASAPRLEDCEFLGSFDYLIDEECTREEIEQAEQKLHELKERLRELEEFRRQRENRGP